MKHSLFALLLLLTSLRLNALVVGYVPELEHSNYVIGASVIESVGFEFGSFKCDVYDLKINSIIYRDPKKNENNQLIPLKSSDTIKFIYARNKIWPDTGYDVMVGKRKELEVNAEYVIPIVFDEALAVWSVSDKFFDITNDKYEKMLIKVVNNFNNDNSIDMNKSNDK